MPSVLARGVRLLGAVVLILLVLVGGPASAQDTESGDEARANAGFVEIIEISGLLDDVVAANLEDAIRSSNADGARALVLQVNSKQAVVSDERLNELATLISESAVPVASWVGPSGSRAAGKVAQLVGVSDSVGVAIGAKLGPTGEQVLDTEQFGEVWGENQQLLEDTALTWEQAIEVGIIPCEIVTEDELGNSLTPDEALARCANPTLGDFLVGLDTFDSRVVDTPEGPRLEPLTQARFRGLSLLDQLMHTVASPPVAYLMLVIGMALIVFEFYSIGIGIAGALGAVFMAFGGYGLAVLPIRGWAVVLLVLAMFAFAIDVQVGIPQAWTVIGMVLFIVGTLFLYPQSDVSMSWIPIVVAIVGMGVVMFRGMPIMVRGRLSTTAIPREFLVDRTGVVVETSEVADTSGGSDVAPREGSSADASEVVTVDVDGAQWRATSTSDLDAGAEVVVTGVDGLVLEVEASAGVGPASAT